MRHNIDIKKKAKALNVTKHSHIDFCENVATCRTIKEAAKKTGYARTYAHVLLRKPEVKKLIEFIRGEDENS